MSAAVAGAAANVAIAMPLMTSLFMTTLEPTTKIFVSSSYVARAPFTVAARPHRAALCGA
jgi:hypothetical protein